MQDDHKSIDWEKKKSHPFLIDFFLVDKDTKPSPKRSFLSHTHTHIGH